MRVCCLDADSLIYIVCHNKKKFNEDGSSLLDDLGEQVTENKSLADCKILADDMIKNILRMTKSSHYLLALTVGRNFRYEVYPEYKANRKYSDKPEHFDRIKEYLITDWKAYYINGLEADDIVRACSLKYEGFIASPDKDILNLKGSHFDYKNFKWVQTNEELANHEFWKDMIIGQPGDNVKGIPGIGKDNKIFKEGLFKASPEYVLGEYINKLGEEKGIQEFYKNYQVLKIRDKLDFYPEPIEFKMDEAGDIKEERV